MMLRNGNFLLNPPVEVSKQFFYVMGIVISSFLIEHLVQIKETHKNMDHLLSAVNYQEYKLLICEN